MDGNKRKRRRKSRPAPSAGPAPLQPIYPDKPEAADHEMPPPQPPRSAEASGEQSATPRPQRSRRRRRGGRGRGEQRQAKSAPLEQQPVEGEEAPPEGYDNGPGETTAVPGTAPAPPVPMAFVPRPSATSTHKRQPKGTVVLAIGLPGSGKTSWFRRRGVTPLSSDLLRMVLFDDITEQRYQDLVFSTLRYLLRARMIARMPWNYVDATNLSPRERRGWIKMAQEFGYEAHAVFFDVPMEVCSDRNRRRGRIVPDEIMQRMAGKLRPPTFEEGFAKITVVRVKHRGAEESGDAETMPSDLDSAEPVLPPDVDSEY